MIFSYIFHGRLNRGKDEHLKNRCSNSKTKTQTNSIKKLRLNVFPGIYIGMWTCVPSNQQRVGGVSDLLQDHVPLKRFGITTINLSKS